MERAKGQQTKEKIIRIAARLFLEKGYHATGINEILAKAQVPKGSFYFHFANKKELAAKVAQYYSTRLEAWFAQTARGRDWKAYIAALAADMKAVAEGGRHLGCPLGVLGVEIAFVEPEIADLYGQAMNRIIGIFAEVLKQSGIQAAQAESLARRAYFLYQGYLQYYRVTRDVGVFDEIRRDVANVIN